MKDGGPAFPIVGPDQGIDTGMTLRDYFAAKAMQGIQACPVGSYKDLVADIACLAYKQADAMLAEREKGR